MQFMKIKSMTDDALIEASRCGRLYLRIRIGKPTKNNPIRKKDVVTKQYNITGCKCSDAEKSQVFYWCNCKTVEAAQRHIGYGYLYLVVFGK